MNNRTLLTVTLATVLGACSGIKTAHDFNPSVSFDAFQTYDWMPEPESRGGGMMVDNDLVVARVLRAIETVMSEKGLERVTSGEPDFRVGYHLALDQEVSYTTMNSGYGSSWGYGMYRSPYMRGSSMTTSTTTQNNYEVGTLIIDVFDVDSHELVWRGSGEGKMRDDNPDPRERQYRADEAVRLIMRPFPPNG